MDMSSDSKSIEFIVVDNGSKDGTLESIKDLPICVFEKPNLKGKKYAVLNYGYQRASGEVIIFLDADTLLPKNFDLLIGECLNDTTAVGGAFDFQFRERRWYLQGLAAINRVRMRLDHNFLGDQALFCRKSILDELGGYPEKLIMESSYLCKQLKKKGKLKLVPAPIYTSARRFLENGFLRVFWYDFKVWLIYLAGLEVNQFGSAYWQHNDTPNE